MGSWNNAGNIWQYCSHTQRSNHPADKCDATWIVIQVCRKVNKASQLISVTLYVRRVDLQQRSTFTNGKIPLSYYGVLRFSKFSSAQSSAWHITTGTVTKGELCCSRNVFPCLSILHLNGVPRKKPVCNDYTVARTSYASEVQLTSKLNRKFQRY